MARKPYPSEAADRFIIRLPDGMRDRIAAEAKAAGRSMNAEIIARLEKSFEDDDYLDDVERRLQALEQMVDVHHDYLGLKRDRK